MSASAGQNPVTGTTYSAASLPTQVSFGSSDTDSFTYDPNTNRMNQYKFIVNGQSVVGALNWNAIGTLGTLTITDPFYGAGNQTCNYTHDDLSRIASAGCGSAWSQTFGYSADTTGAFGNLSKSGTVSFQPTYSYLTNRMTMVGSSTPSYDLNGNATNDTVHTYAWDAAGRPVTIDSVGLTYDALGRMAEQNKGGAFSQIVYTPQGNKFALMNGQTLGKAFVPLPGGSQAVYTPSGLAYYRHADWVGSARFASTPSRTMYFDGAYAPFGEAYAETGTTDLSFTGENQDTVANLYDFPAREYNDIQGRWPSPDPAGVGSVTLSSPQSLNRYAYVMNLPTGMTDPEGMRPCALTSQGDSPCGNGGSCSIDGIATDCSTATALLQGGLGVQCPDNVCEGTGPDGRQMFFFVTVNGGGSYYAYSGYGALFFSADAAAIGFVNSYESLSETDQGEYNTTIYQDSNGVYSYSDPSFSACDPISGTPFSSCVSAADPTNVPDDATAVGTAHTHPLEDAMNQSDIIYGGDIVGANSLYLDYPTINAQYVGTVSGRVLLYVPSLYVPGNPNQCQATFVIQGSQSLAPCTPY
ncbi:MAG TPA: RHS repeat-associated core domain-containing protein [Candidatus Acidoferrales bacterium]|nr:RHS repeat-associated core domain-containing protein [Candidatus Acidoferrales bacterium]